MRLQRRLRRGFPDDLPRAKDTVARLDRLVADATDEAEKSRRRGRWRSVQAAAEPRSAGGARPMRLHRLRVSDFARFVTRSRIRPRAQRTVRAERSREVDVGGRHPTGAAPSSRLDPLRAYIAVDRRPGSGRRADVPNGGAAHLAHTEEVRQERLVDLEESKNGQDFDEVERGRKVDGKLGRFCAGGYPSRAAPAAARAFREASSRRCYSRPRRTSARCSASSLQDDPTGNGKDRIAAALQAVAQDPLFVALLRDTQAKRDEAYTDKGAKKTAKGSVFKAAADRVNDARRREGAASQDCRRLGERRSSVAGIDGEARTS